MTDAMLTTAGAFLGVAVVKGIDYMLGSKTSLRTEEESLRRDMAAAVDRLEARVSALEADRDKWRDLAYTRSEENAQLKARIMILEARIEKIEANGGHGPARG